MTSSDPARPKVPPVGTTPHSWLPSQFKDLDFELVKQHKNDPAQTPANEERKRRSIREYTLGEEIFNSITHGVGVLLAMAAIPILVVHAVRDGGGVYLAAALIYTLTMLLEYVMSTLYHAISARRAKRVFKVLDHSCIYLFIAGSYTPFCLITLAPYGGLWLFAFVWAVSLAGVATEAFWVFRPRWIAAVLYLLIGWSIVGFLPTLVVALPQPALWLLVAGGVAYSIGCVFYVLKKIPYMHSLFHLWVLAGSVLQFLAVALYVI
ncbi:PAQR family membrane homeostasis protein TrhA [Xiamenia xianingshaonis]|uniref:Hemolysin III family protein n=1 Tax=Xiamenia xianingshaonis TaxID=2682776 RepID=A0A9E6SU10_9ACTN|nr:hemolysin III family protein [Xiamenia xianingshaonis]NHM14130.1 hemolysin III family protein [Xiamenia xianingshaonis]QTU83991.1 hemolysin III family protein [Xiamenia xianingshaonis]